MGFLEKQNQQDVYINIYIEREVYFKELAYVIMEAGQIQNLVGEGWKPGDRGKAWSLIPVAVCW